MKTLQLKTNHLSRFIDHFARKHVDKDKPQFGRRIQRNSAGNYGTQKNSYTGCCFVRPSLHGVFIARPFIFRKWGIGSTHEEMQYRKA